MDQSINSTGSLDQLNDNLKLIKLDDKQINNIKDMINFSHFYFVNAEKLCNYLIPMQNETLECFTKRLKKNLSKKNIKRFFNNNNGVDSLSLVKTNELIVLYSNESIKTILTEKFKTPFELLEKAYKKAKKDDCLTDFFQNAFTNGCINLKTNKLSLWLSKNNGIF